MRAAGLHSGSSYSAMDSTSRNWTSQDKTIFASIGGCGLLCAAASILSFLEGV